MVTTVHYCHANRQEVILKHWDYPIKSKLLCITIDWMKFMLYTNSIWSWNAKIFSSVNKTIFEGVAEYQAGTTSEVTRAMMRRGKKRQAPLAMAFRVGFGISSLVTRRCNYRAKPTHWSDYTFGLRVYWIYLLLHLLQ